MTIRAEELVAWQWSPHLDDPAQDPLMVLPEPPSPATVLRGSDWRHVVKLQDWHPRLATHLATGTVGFKGVLTLANGVLPG